jgi:hypothetical protein
MPTTSFSTATFSTVTVSSISSTSKACIATRPPTVGRYAYQGCYTDGYNGGALTERIIRDAGMTLEKCASTCADYPFFGVEAGVLCFCGSYLDPSALKTSDAQCSVPCSGDPRQICGAGDRITIYADPQLAYLPPNVPNAGSFEYMSCWVDFYRGRMALADAVWRSDDMTADVCAEQCAEFVFFGLDGGRCHCGNELLGVTAPETDCTRACLGDDSIMCGGPSRLSVYVQSNAYPFRRA